MATVDKGDLEKVMSDAGLSERTKKKLRSANAESPVSDAPAPAPAPRGRHGNAAQTQPIIDEL